MKKTNNPKTFMDHLSNKMVDKYLEEKEATGTQPINEVGHTPGPWEPSKSGLLTNDGHLPVIHYGEEHKHIALVYTQDANVKKKDLWNSVDPERNANARLIAAAPDMLELLKWISRGTNNPEIGIRCDKMIAKATNS